MAAAASGRRVWKAPNRRDRMSFGGAVAYDGGRIYAHSGYNYFVALDAESGDEIWRSEVLVPFHGGADRGRWPCLRDQRQ